jgi:hypothetical protein
MARSGVRPTALTPARAFFWFSAVCLSPRRGSHKSAQGLGSMIRRSTHPTSVRYPRAPPGFRFAKLLSALEYVREA